MDSRHVCNSPHGNAVGVLLSRAFEKSYLFFKIFMIIDEHKDWETRKGHSAQ